MHPILFKIGEFEIRTYGVIVATAILIAIYISMRLFKKEGYNPEMVLDIATVGVITGIIGARLLYVIAQWKEEFANNPMEIFKIWHGGIVFYGGFIGGLIGVLWYLKRKKLPLLKVLDILIISMPLAHAVGRIGCFYNGCCYGVVNYKFGVIFPAIGDNLPHLPTQLYESVLNFLNFIILILYYKYRKRREGEVFFLYFINYGIIRFILEFFRGDPERGKILFLSTSMFISIFIFLIGIIGSIYIKKKNNG